VCRVVFTVVVELWGRQYDSHDSDYTNYANTCSDLYHGLTDELEFYLDRGNEAALRYSQRPERRDDERSERVVEFI
jgi:hypothetical protein